MKHIATLWFIGYMPVAPGTFGTIAAFLVYVALQPPPALHLLLVLVIVPLGIVAAHRTEKMLREKDSSHIVIDEFCGYLCSVLFLPSSVRSALTAFILFRLFDILKPFPIRRIESSLGGGIGIMADDILAAIYTNISLRVLFAMSPTLIACPR